MAAVWMLLMLIATLGACGKKDEETPRARFSHPILGTWKTEDISFMRQNFEKKGIAPGGSVVFEMKADDTPQNSEQMVKGDYVCTATATLNGKTEKCTVQGQFYAADGELVLQDIVYGYSIDGKTLTLTADDLVIVLNKE